MSKDVEEARNQLLDLLEAAQRGCSTIITKHGRPVAAIVPLDEVVGRSSQLSLLPWKGTGRGLWGKGAGVLRDVRGEWSR